MKTLTVRNVPETVYSELVKWAKANHRSLQEQVKYLIEEDVQLRGVSVMESAATYRAKLASRKLGSVVGDVREDRQRCPVPGIGPTEGRASLLRGR